MKELITSEHGSIECFSYLKKHDLVNYDKDEVANPEGDEDKAQEGFSQSQEDYFHLHWFSHISSLYAPKYMFGTMTSLYGGKNIKDDIEEPTEECEDTELRDHAIPLHKGFSNQRTT